MATIGPVSFKGGWNPKANVYSLAKDQMSDAQNVNIVYDSLVKRNGSVLLNASAFASGAAVHGLADWQIASGTRFQVVTAGTKIGSMTALGGTITDITGSATITSGANNQHTFASLNNILVICGGATPDTPLQWTGSGNVSSLSGSPPTGNIVTVANNFMFIGGIAATPSRVFWSNYADPQTWTNTNFLDFRISDGDVITALVEMNQNLVIFKKRSIGQLWTVSQTVAGAVTLGPLTQIVTKTGCVGPLAVDKLPDGRLVFFGSNAHVYIFDGSTPQDISDPEPPGASIQNILDQLPEGQLPYVVLRVYPTKSEIVISAATGSSTTNNVVFVYNYTLETWESQFTGIAANVMCTAIDTRANPQRAEVWLTGNYAGQVFEQDRGSTNAEDANSMIDGYGTKAILLGAGNRDFLPFMALINLLAQGNFDLEFNYGFDGLTETTNSVLVNQSSSLYTLDSFPLDTGTLAGNSTALKQIPLVSIGQSQSMQIQLRNRNASQPFTVNSLFLSDDGLI